MAFFEVLGLTKEKLHYVWEHVGVVPQSDKSCLDWNPASVEKYCRIRYQGHADFVQAQVGTSDG